MSIYIYTYIYIYTQTHIFPVWMKTDFSPLQWIQNLFSLAKNGHFPLRLVAGAISEVVPWKRRWEHHVAG